MKAEHNSPLSDASGVPGAEHATFYESDRAVSEYLLFHYGRPDEILAHPFGPKDALDFPMRCVTECVDRAALQPAGRALDLGCAVGRSTFELTRFCGEVIGIDSSRRFIDAANTLRNRGSLEYAFTDEGDLTVETAAVVPSGIDRSRARFEKGDAMSLRRDLGRFDVVLMANLIDRLPDPRSCLANLAEVINESGQLIVVSPYTWLAEFTPRKNWLGGFVRDCKRVKTLGTLKELLGRDFEFSGTKDLPFLIREHARKFQWSVAEASLWRKR